MSEATLNGLVLEQLYQTILSRRDGNPKESHTAKLFSKGRNRICKKFGEEATEVIIAALAETPADVVSESSDVLYHLLVLWAEVGVTPDQVWAELKARVGTSGIEEKRNRENRS